MKPSQHPYRLGQDHIHQAMTIISHRKANTVNIVTSTSKWWNRTSHTRNSTARTESTTGALWSTIMTIRDLVQRQHYKHERYVFIVSFSLFLLFHISMSLSLSFSKQQKNLLYLFHSRKSKKQKLQKINRFLKWSLSKNTKVISKIYGNTKRNYKKNIILCFSSYFLINFKTFLL